MAGELVFYSFFGFIFGVLASGGDWRIRTLILGFFIIFTLIFLLKKSYLKYALIFIICCFLGIFYFSFYENIAGKDYPPMGNKVQITFILDSEPQFSEKIQSVDAKLLAPYGGKIKILADTSKILKYGDKIKAEGSLNQSSKTENPFLRLYDFEVLSENNGSFLKNTLLDIKNYSLSRIKKYLSPEAGAFLGGLILGDRNDFSAEFKNSMKLSGTTHLVALSGYNISILVFAFGTILGTIINRKVKFLVICLAIFLFVIMVGAEASVLRAGIMGVLMLFAKEFGRDYSPRQAIILTAGVMILYDPMVLFEIGFELSFLSLFGIVYALPSIKEFFRIREISKLKEEILTTISAQLAVLPLIILYFGSFSLLAIISNSLILPLVPLAMFFGFAMIIAEVLFPPLAWFFGLCAGLILKYFMVIIDFFGKYSLPFGNFLTLPIFLVIYYLLLLYLIYAKYPDRI